MEKDFKLHPNDLLGFMATFLKKHLPLVFLFYALPQICKPLPPIPHMFIIFLLLRSSKLHLWMWHSEHHSFILPLLMQLSFGDSPDSSPSKGFTCSACKGTGLGVSLPRLGVLPVPLARRLSREMCCLPAENNSLSL